VPDICASIGIKPADLYPENSRGNGHSSKREIVATYDYVDEAGALLYQAVRFVPKAFTQRRPDGAGHWVWGLGTGDYEQSRTGDWYRVKPDKPPTGTVRAFPDTERVLFHLPQLLDKLQRPRGVIFYVEGEKDALALERLGFTVTTHAGGAKAWRQSYADVLSRAHKLYVIPDNDAPGLEMAQRICSQCANAALLELPGLAPKQDVSDWIAAGGTREALIDLAREAWERRDSTRTAPAPAAPMDVTQRPPALVEAMPLGLEPIKALCLTDVANAWRLSALHGDDLWHSTALGWLCWDGTRWARNEKAAQYRAQDVGPEVYRELMGCKAMIEMDVYKAVLRHAQDASKSRGVTAALQLGRVLPDLDGDHLPWDEKPWILNCPNGALNLRVGTLHPHLREDYLTQLCPTSYVPGAACSRWHQFLQEVFLDDAAVIDYVQWVLGYALTGCTDYDAFFILHGSGSNGKSTFIRTLKHVLGRDYSHEFDSEELLQQRHARHSTERAALMGKRFVSTSETAEGRRLNEQLVKHLTGGDAMRARFMHRDSFEFTPALKLFLATNHLPVIRDDSTGMWRRVRLLPFEAIFEGAAKDPDLEDKLAAEAEGILAWCVAGAQRVVMGEPDLPERVRLARDEYQSEQDTLQQFIDSECTIIPEIRCGKTQLYNAFKAWNGGRAESQKKFTQQLQKRGFQESRGHGGHKTWVGIGLNAGSEGSPGEPLEDSQPYE